MPRKSPLSQVQANHPAINQPSQTTDAPPVEQAPFMRCKCVGAMPGRCCPRCSGTRWLKRCLTCNGSGLIFKNRGKGSQPLSERCGPCMGIGWKSCMPGDRAEIAKFEASQPEPVAV